MNIDNYQNLVIYGTGKCAEAFLDYADISVDNLHVVSSTKNELHGKPSVRLDQLDTSKNYTIVIASQYIAEIYQTIENSNLQIDDVAIFLYSKRQFVKAENYLRMYRSGKTLFAFYDLELNGATFDACVFANAAEEQRISLKLQNLCFVIVPPITKLGNDDWFRLLYQNGNEAAFNDRVNHLLIPIFQLIPSCIACVQLVERKDVDKYHSETYKFPLDFDINKPSSYNIPNRLLPHKKPVGHFSSPKRASDYISQFFSKERNRKVLTFTIREYLEQPERNNNLEELKKYLSSLDLQEFLPIIVRDTSSAGFGCLQGFEDFCHFPEASLDLGIRMALYEYADLNIFVNNGPVALVYFNKKCNYIIFKIAIDTMECTSTKILKDYYSLEPKENTFFFASNPNQKVCWEEDNAPNMTKYVHQMLDNIAISKESN